eukprot:g4803.t1
MFPANRLASLGGAYDKETGKWADYLPPSVYPDAYSSAEPLSAAQLASCAINKSTIKIVAEGSGRGLPPSQVFHTKNGAWFSLREIFCGPSGGYFEGLHEAGCQVCAADCRCTGNAAAYTPTWGS